MKGLTLTQPWASLVACGAKQIETRSWSTSYRGPLVIHAAKNWKCEDRSLFDDEWFVAPLSCIGIYEPAHVPLGTIVAVCRLEDIEPTSVVRPRLLGFSLDDEYEYGDYSDGRFAWHLKDVIALPEPIPWRGMLGLWDVPAELAAKLPEPPTW